MYKPYLLDPICLGKRGLEEEQGCSPGGRPGHPMVMLRLSLIHLLSVEHLEMSPESCSSHDWSCLCCAPMEESSFSKRRPWLMSLPLKCRNELCKVIHPLAPPAAPAAFLWFLIFTSLPLSGFGATDVLLSGPHVCPTAPWRSGWFITSWVMLSQRGDASLGWSVAPLAYGMMRPPSLLWEHSAFKYLQPCSCQQVNNPKLHPQEIGLGLTFFRAAPLGLVFLRCRVGISPCASAFWSAKSSACELMNSPMTSACGLPLFAEENNS